MASSTVSSSSSSSAPVSVPVSYATSSSSSETVSTAFSSESSSEVVKRTFYVATDLIKVLKKATTIGQRDIAFFSLWERAWEMSSNGVPLTIMMHKACWKDCLRHMEAIGQRPVAAPLNGKVACLMRGNQFTLVQQSDTFPFPSRPIYFQTLSKPAKSATSSDASAVSSSTASSSSRDRTPSHLAASDASASVSISSPDAGQASYPSPAGLAQSGASSSSSSTAGAVSSHNASTDTSK